tara:strand:- start:512 stop:886 length:375 start_codon:yes stop_codon:yes gene_type:complete
MSSQKVSNIIKNCVITSTAALILIAVNTTLISQNSTKNSDSLKMESKNILSNLDSLKKELKNISIDLVPSKMHSQKWNNCFKNSVRWINKNEKKLAELDKATKESLAVAVCNGAVYEPTPKIKR